MRVNKKRCSTVLLPETSALNPTVSIQHFRVIGDVREFHTRVTDCCPPHGQELVDQVRSLGNIDTACRFDHRVPHLKWRHASRGLARQNKASVPTPVIVQRYERPQMLLQFLRGQQRFLTD